MNFLPNTTVIVRIDSNGNTNQEILTSDKIDFEAGISITGSNLNISVPSGSDYALTVNNHPVFEVTTSGDVVFTDNVVLNLVGDPEEPNSATTRAYVDNRDALVSGTITSGYTSAISTYSGIVEQRFVNVSGDTMTGSLTMSGVNVLGATSGTSNIGSSGVPFNNIYGNNFYDDGNNPTVAGQLANKQYVDSQLASGTAGLSGVLSKTVSIDFSYASSNVPYVYSQDTTPVIEAWFYFMGTNLFGPIALIKGVGNVATAGATGVCLVRRDSDSAIMASGNIVGTANNVFNFTLVSGNIPTAESLCHITLHRTSGTGKIQLNSLHIRRELN